MDIYYGSATLTNATFSGNQALGRGGISLQNSGPAATLRNSILWLFAREPLRELRGL